jgi:hypothetical protein
MVQCAGMLGRLRPLNGRRRQVGRCVRAAHLVLHELLDGGQALLGDDLEQPLAAAALQQLLVAGRQLRGALRARAAGPAQDGLGLAQHALGLRAHVGPLALERVDLALLHAALPPLLLGRLLQLRQLRLGRPGRACAQRREQQLPDGAGRGGER